jgi:hypothetical protein
MLMACFFSLNGLILLPEGVNVLLQWVIVLIRIKLYSHLEGRTRTFILKNRHPRSAV